MTSILRYASRVRLRTAKRKPTIAIVGAGSLASFLAPALAEAGYTISEIIGRGGSQSLARARALARQVNAPAVTAEGAKLDGRLVWFCVPDGTIREAVDAVAKRIADLDAKTRSVKRKRLAKRYAFHSSGTLPSRELEALRKLGFATASVHPLMTFVPGGRPSLASVPFAMEGDAAATRLARRIVRDFGGESFALPARKKAAYHAWATMTSPLLLAYLVTLEDAARQAGLTREAARRMSLPIIRQTLENYRSLGPQRSFSGPFIRGDAATVARHLGLLKDRSAIRAVYVALAGAALDKLPVKNRKQFRGLVR